MKYARYAFAKKNGIHLGCYKVQWNPPGIILTDGWIQGIVMHLPREHRTNHTFVQSHVVTTKNKHVLMLFASGKSGKILEFG
jgi:hypothetical protein